MWYYKIRVEIPIEVMGAHLTERKYIMKQNDSLFHRLYYRIRRTFFVGLFLFLEFLIFLIEAIMTEDREAFAQRGHQQLGSSVP